MIYALGPVSARDLLQDETKQAVRRAIERVEAQTSAELVVAVRRVAGRYRDADLAWGALASLAALAYLLFADKEFATRFIPLDAAVVFVAAAVLSSQVPPLRRFLVSRARRHDEARRAACTAFHDLGVTGTSGRSGILVLVCLFERRAEVLFDRGIDTSALGSPLAAAVDRIRAAVDRVSPDAGELVAALEALGPVLAPSMPRAHDDVNELPDDVGVA